MNREELTEQICPTKLVSKCYSCDDCVKQLNALLDEYDKQIRADVIEKFAEFLKKKNLLTNFHYHNGEADFDYADIDGYINEFKNQIK